MTQAQAVIETIDKLGGIATLNQINQHIYSSRLPSRVWMFLETPFIRCWRTGRSRDLSRRPIQEDTKRCKSRCHDCQLSWLSLRILKKMGLLFGGSIIFLYLWPAVLGTFVRKIANSFAFSLTYSYLCSVQLEAMPATVNRTNNF